MVPPEQPAEPQSPDLDRVNAAFELISQEGMTPELAEQILRLGDSSPPAVLEAADRVAAEVAALRRQAEAALQGEEQAHRELVARLERAAQEEQVDYQTALAEEEKLLAAARALRDQVTRVRAFFKLPADDEPERAQPADRSPLESIIGIFVQRAEPARQPGGAERAAERAAFDPDAEAVRKVGILASLAALPNRTVEQVEAMLKSQRIDRDDIEALVRAASAMAEQQIMASEAAKQRIEAQHAEEVARFQAARAKENAQYQAARAAAEQVLARTAEIAARVDRLRRFFGAAGGR